MNKYNYSREIVGDEIYENLNMKIAYLIPDHIMLLMLELGIPIGIVEEIGNKYLYKPINNTQEILSYYAKYNGYVDLRVHPDFLSKEKVNHIAYCLEFANNTNFFDIKTMNNLQNEIINSIPLDYKNAMKIFNKYYTKKICSIFINEYKVNIDDFFYLSGLDKNKMR